MADQSKRVALTGEVCTVDLGRHVARACSDDQATALAQQDHEPAGAGQSPAALDDQLQDPCEISLTADRPRDRRRRLQAPDGTLEFTAALLAVLVEPGVLDRDRRPLREHQDRLFVGLAERLAVGLVAQVQIAPRLAADQHRYAEERLHRRMAGREAERARIVAHGVEPQRPRVGDHRPEDAAPARRIADLAVRGLRDAVRDEALELGAALIENAERRIAGARHVRGRREHAVEHRLHVEFGDDGTTRI